jgi:polysaccharide export outer membrane protein
MVRVNFKVSKVMEFSFINGNNFHKLAQPVTSLTVTAIVAITTVFPSMALATSDKNSVNLKIAQVQLEQEYTLGAGDKIQVDIFNVPEYSGENGRYQILVDGSLNLPLIGRLVVEGLTLEQTARLLEQRYATYLTRPIVTVTLVEPRPLDVAVAGEVNRPGSYVLGGVSGGESQSVQIPTITRAIQSAGGVTKSADLRQVILRRRTGGFEQVLNVNVWALLQQGDLSQDITLRDGDSIFIPTLTNFNVADASQLASANIAGDPTRPLNVAVVGEVNRPGSYILQTVDDQGAQLGLVTVTRAIQSAGGITQSADLRRIQVRRTTKAGSEQVIDVNLWQLLQAGDLSQDILLDQGDTIVIPTAEDIDLTEVPQVATASFSPEAISVNVVGEVVEPGRIAVPPNTSLNQVIMAAGGFDNRRARKSEVELLRLNPNGTVSRRTIKVDLSQELNEETNPAMRPNDVIIVGRSRTAKTSDTVTTLLSPFTSIFSVFRIFELLF